jgi:hypothetical protein
MTSQEQITQDIIFILDQSGSMSSMGDEPVQAVNSFIESQKKTLTEDNSTFSLWTFNTKVTKVFDDVPLQQVTEFTNFCPSDMTALYDAIGEAINTKKQKAKHDNVVCVILTDGLENSSQEFSAKNIRDMIKDMEDNHNWKFIYLGANQDAFAVGGNMGMKHCAEYRCAVGEMIGITREVSEAISSYRSSSASIGKEATLNINRSQSVPVTSQNRD